MSVVGDIHNHTIPEGFIQRVRDEGRPRGFALRPAPMGLDELVMPSGEGVLLRPDRCDGAVRQRELAKMGVGLSVEGAAPWVNVYGSDVVHGTDYPADMSDRSQVAAIRARPRISTQDADAILGGNLLRLIGRTA
jgi:hypothetical protein